MPPIPPSTALPSGYPLTVWNDENVGRNSLGVGLNPMAKGDNSVALGTRPLAFADSSLVGGDSSRTDDGATNSFTWGDRNQITAPNGGAFGQNNLITDEAGFATGRGNQVSGEAAFATGIDNQVSGAVSTAFGTGNIVGGSFSHSSGRLNRTMNRDNNCHGFQLTITDEGIPTVGTVLRGRYGIARAEPGDQYSWQLAGGDNTTSLTNPGDGIVVVIKTTVTGIAPEGEGFATAWNAGGADFAEYYEWEDGNPKAEDRVGYFVEHGSSHPNKMSIATSGKDELIFGVVSATAAYVANSQELHWWGVNERDEFARLVTDEIDGVKVARTSHLHEPGRKYIPRSQRKEWDVVGLVGQVYVRDDGSCKPGSWCCCRNGIAVACEYSKELQCWLVQKRISAGVIVILMR